MRNYWWAVTWAGGQPVMLTPGAADLPPDEQLARLDGLLLSGGGDVHPRYYGQPINGSDPDDIQVERDELELPLARAALAADMPILAICRGMQMLNIAAGGSLVQHIDGHRSPPDRASYHDVDVCAGTLLARVLDTTGPLATNTYHHQAVTLDVLAPGFRPSGLTVEAPTLVEAMESQTARWAVAVQWHPERFYELDPRHQRLFSEFVRRAGA
ncbi:MAG: gamma-glutamyl-gamma-aminobutyrate hydrolase family protein [Caldilineales bacterium]